MENRPHSREKRIVDKTVNVEKRKVDNRVSNKKKVSIRDILGSLLKK